MMSRSRARWQRLAAAAAAVVALAGCGTTEVVPPEAVEEARENLDVATDRVQTWAAEPDEMPADELADHATELRGSAAELRAASDDADELPARALEEAATDLETFSDGLDDAAGRGSDERDAAWLSELNEQWREADRSLRVLEQIVDED